MHHITSQPSLRLNDGANDPFESFRRKCLSASSDAAEALVRHLDHRNPVLDLSKCNRATVSNLDDRLVREFHHVCKRHNNIVFDLILPDGMDGVPSWTSELWLKTLQAHAMSWPGVDMTEELPRFGALEQVDFSGSDFSDSRWHDLDSCPRLDLRNANLSGASFRSTRLVGTDLRGALLEQVSFDQVDLSRSKLDDCDIAGSHWNCTELVEVQAGSMRNAESARFVRCPILNADLPASLTSKLKSDDILRPGDSLFVDASCQYKHVIGQMCVAKELRYEEVSFDFWTRDAYFRAVHPPQAVFIAPTENIDRPKFSSLAGAHVDSFRRNPLSRPDLSLAPPAESEKDYKVRHEAAIKDDRLKRMRAVEGHFLEGGNIIITSDGVAVVGHDEIRHGQKEPEGPVDEEQLRLAVNLYPGVDPGKAIALWTAGVHETARVQKVLGARKLVVIPQYLFHDDLQVTYTGGSRFLVNSFSETLRLLKENQAAFTTEFGEQGYERACQKAQSVIDAGRDQASVGDATALLAYLRANREEMVRQFGETQFANAFATARAQVEAGGEERLVDEAMRRMEAAGLKATKAALSVLAGPIKWGKWQEGLGQVSSLLGNGLMIEDNDGERTYVTLGAKGMTTHKQYFCEVLAGQGIHHVEFMADEHWTGDVPSPADFIDRYSGGLRCLTQKNLYPMLDHQPQFI
jgi:uncharacterized protein YjbI with pentapeptide repeats